MAHVDDETLSRFLDGELGQAEAARVRAALDDDAAARERLARLRRVRVLIRVAADVRVAEADDALDGLYARIRAGIERDVRPTLAERARAWWGEFVEHRRVVWMPAGAAVVVAAAVLLIGLSHGGVPGPTPVGERPMGTRVEEISFGGGGGAVFEVPTGSNGVTAVIWLNDQGAEEVAP